MNCPTVLSWLLVSRADEALPVEVARHLQTCGKCRRKRRRLVRLDRETALVPAPLPDPAIKQRLLARLPSRPDSEDKGTPASRRQGKRSTILAAALTLLVVCVCGALWVAARQNAPSVDHVVNPALQKNNGVPQALAERKVDGLLRESYLRLAQTYKPLEQWNILLQLADQLRSETLRQAKSGLSEEGVTVTNLYGIVLQQGLAAHFASLSWEQREQVMPAFLRHLDVAQTEMAQAAEDAPVGIGDSLHSVEATARQLSVSVRGDVMEALQDADAPRPPLAMPSESWPALLVQQCVQLTDEYDPLLRAQNCLQTAHHVVQDLLWACARGDQQRATVCSKNLEQILERGVQFNVCLVQSEHPDDLLLVGVALLNHRAASSVDHVEKMLTQVHPEAKIDRLYNDVKELQTVLQELEKTLDECIGVAATEPIEAEPESSIRHE